MKNFYIQDNIGSAKYAVSYHDGIKTHKDGSLFYDIKTFSNKIVRDKFIQQLKNEGYPERNLSVTAKIIEISVPMRIDLEQFKMQRGYLNNEHCNNPENKELEGIVNILDHIADKMMDDYPELEGKLS